MFGLHGRRDGLLRVAGKCFPITKFRQLCPYETDTFFFYRIRSTIGFRFTPRWRPFP